GVGPSGSAAARAVEACNVLVSSVPRKESLLPMHFIKIATGKTPDYGRRASPRQPRRAHNADIPAKITSVRSAPPARAAFRHDDARRLPSLRRCHGATKEKTGGLWLWSGNG